MSKRAPLMAQAPLPQVEILGQEFNNRCDQWNKAVRALKIGGVYAEIWLHPEGDAWKGQRPPTLKVLHPLHGELQLYCPTPKTPWPGTYSPDGAEKTVALMHALEELTTYLQGWVRAFV